MTSTSPNIMLHLLRKESRQLMPLIAILALLALAFQFLGLINGEMLSRLGEVALVGMPSLFAVGAGALLVGQEKEQRTMNWLQTMPIPKAEVVRSKLLAALLSLVVVWLVSLTLYGLFLPLRNRTTNAWYVQGFFSVFNWPLNTLFLLVCGVWLAWRLKSSFNSLFAIIPLAILPWAVSESLVQIIRNLTTVKLEPNSDTLALLNAGCLTIGAIVVGALGWRSGLRCLQAAPAPTTKSILGAFSNPNQSTDWMQRTPPAQTHALIRQFFNQHRIELISIFTILSVTLVVLAYCGFVQFYQSSGEFNVVLGVALVINVAFTSYLGVVSFQGDQLQNRVRFLADRGVEPRLVWCTRHAVPVAILLLVSMWVFLLIATTSPFRRLPSLMDRVFVASFLCVAFSSASVLIYSYSQWVGQLIRSPIVAVIVAPAFVVLIAMYWLFAFLQLDAPMWLLGLSGLIPLVATWTMMKRWMNGENYSSYLMRHGAWLFACLALPFLSFFYALATQPRMPESLRGQLESIARKYESQLNPPKLKQRSIVQNLTNKEPDDREKTLSAMRMVQASFHKQISAEIERGSRIDHWAYQKLLDDLLFERTLWDSEPTEDTQKRFREFFELALKGTEAMRRSLELIDQDYADAAEVELLRQLRKPDTEKILGRNRYLRALRIIADSTGRDEARLRAVAVNWWSYGRSNTTVEGYRFYEIQDRQIFSLTTSFLSHRMMGVKVAHLLAILDATDSDAIDRARAIVLTDWNGSQISSDPLCQETMQYVRFYIQAPGSLWRGRWEQQAVELLKSASEGNNE